MVHPVTATGAAGGHSAPEVHPVGHATEMFTKTVEIPEPTESTVTSRLLEFRGRLEGLCQTLSQSCCTLMVPRDPEKVVEASEAMMTGIDRILSDCEMELSRVEAFAGEISRQL